MAILKVKKSKNCYRDDNVFYYVISYCVDAKKTRGNHIITRAVSSIEHAAQQMETVCQNGMRRNGAKIRHCILSFDEKEHLSGCDASSIANKLVDFYSSQFQIIAAVHDTTEHLHIHFVMNTTSYLDGHTYAGKKKDYYAFIAYAKKILKRYGVTLYVERAD